MNSTVLHVLVCVALVLGIGLAYGELCDAKAEFCVLDDGVYVLSNAHVHGGLSPEGVAWAFTTFDAGNWHPLTWLSLQLDHDLYGLDAGGFHLTNMLLHMANAMVLFLMLRWATGAFWRSAIVAALFAFHPLHVESVAWITERKDVLSTLFWLLTMLAYVWYVRRPGTGRYLAVLVAFAVGLMAKQMLVTLPCVLLLFDYWPLQRLDGTGSAPRRRILIEKIPLFALAAIACWVTAQAQLGQEPVLPPATLVQRGLNAGLAYAGYLRKTFWPDDLAPLYTRPLNDLPVGDGIIAAIILLIVTAAAIGQLRRRPYLAVGWFWFLGTLVPVIGLVTIGIQTMADRYTYVPNIGLYVMLVWGVAAMIPERWPRPVLAAATGLILLAALVVARYDAGLWHNNLDLWGHAVRMGGGFNFGAHEQYGAALMTRNRGAEGIEEFRTTVRIEPLYARGHYNLGRALEERRRWSEAAASFAEALRLSPGLVGPHAHLGLCLMQDGRMVEALAPLRIAVEREPGDAATRTHLAMASMYAGKFDDAVREARATLAIDPSQVPARIVLGTSMAVLGRVAEADGQFREALRIDPQRDASAPYFLAWCMNAAGRPELAREQYRAARKRFPNWPFASRKEAWQLATHADPSRRNGPLALFRAQTVSQALEDQDVDALTTLGAAYAECQRFDDALSTARKALALTNDRNARASLEQQIRMYESKQPFHE